MPAQAQERPARAGPLRGIAALLGGALLLAALLILGRELIAAQVPQHRAALEEFIRHETGLEITFSRLSVRWGWYGPEAVFDSAALGEPDAPAVLRAAQVVVAVDAWRSMRSGQLEAGRIRLINPEIDLTGPGSDAAATTDGRRAASASALADAPRWLARWRGGRVDIENGAVRWPGAPGTSPLTVNVRRAQLRRLGAQWSAEAHLLLPDSLGTAAEFATRFSGDIAHPDTLSGTLTFRGERLAFEGWRHFALTPAVAAYLPRRGGGNLELQGAFRGGRFCSLAGDVQAQSLEWAPRAASAVPLALPALRARWRLLPADAGWRLSAQALELGTSALHGAAQLSFDANTVRATLADLPVGALAALVHWWAPQAPLAQLLLSGRARTLGIDWDARRPAGERLLAAADLEELTLASVGGDVALSGLSAHLRTQDTRLTGAFTAQAARLLARREQPLALEGLQLQAHVAAALEGTGWRLNSEDFELRAGAARIEGRIGLDATVAAPARLDARVQLRETDVASLAVLLGPGALRALGLGATRLSAGRIASGEFELHGALTPAGEFLATGADSHGTLELRDAALEASEAWPGLEGLAARIDWHGTQVRANVIAARSGTLALSGAQAQWDTSGVHALRASARLAGEAQQVLEWLRERPRLAGSAPLVYDLDLEGDTQLNVDLVLPGTAAPRAPPRLRIVAALQGARLRPLPGVPPIESLHGTLVFSAAHLQRATLVGRWLGGPVTLGVAEQREGADTGLTLTAHGLIEARQALLAANSADAGAPVLGATDWNAQLLLLPQTDPAQPQWRLHVESSLAGVTSELPEPFGKASAAALPLHLEVQGRGAQAQLRLALGERLQSVALLARSGDRWRIERGTLRLGSGTPELPGAPVLSFEGRVARLDLPAYLALWQQIAAAQTLPPVQARLSTAELIAGRAYGEASVAATGITGGAQVSVEAAQLHGVLHWPARPDAAHVASVQLATLEGSGGDAAFAVQLPALLGPAVDLSVDDFRWQGRSLGRLHARLTAAGERLQVRDLRLTGAQQELRGVLECVPQARCTAHLSLKSSDLARTLADYGLRADMTALRAQLEGDLEWPQGSAAPLATLSGDLHMQLEEGAAQASGEDAREPFALFLVPGLLRGLQMQADRVAGTAPLRFAHVTADFALRDGVASSANLRLDGADAEILMWARVNLLARDYDGEAFILRGEERLPSPLRGLGPTPRVAALWLSLRQWFTGAAPEDTGTGLRLRGAWNDPIVTPAQ